MRKIHSQHFINAYAIDFTATPSFILCNPSPHSPKHLQEPGLCMKDCGDDEMLDDEYLDDWPFENQSGYSTMPGLQYMLDSDYDSIPNLHSISDFNTQSESQHSIPDLESVAESDCNSIPDMLSISDSNICSESRRSVPDLESATESDCDSIPDLLSISNSDAQSESRHSMPDLELAVETDCDSIPDLLSVSDSDAQSEFGHSVPDLESVAESDYESSTVSVMDYTCDNCVPDLPFTMAGTDSKFLLLLNSNCEADNHVPVPQLVADMTSNSVNYSSKDEYITNWLSTSYISTYKSARPMTGGGGDPSDIAATLPTHSAPAENSGSDAPLPNLPFNRDAWIGCGKVWNDNIPKEVCEARNAARRIPSGVITALIPSASLNVTDLLSKHLMTGPGHSSAKSASYDSRIPNTFVGDSDGLIFQSNIRECRAHLFASLDYASLLRTQFNTAWLSGARSILLPGDPISRYPLWIEHVLSDLEISTRKERAWVKASDWLYSTAANSIDSDTTAMVGDCFERFNEIPWDSIVPGFSEAVSLSTKDLAAFLSDDWLNDEMLNAGIDFITRHLENQSRARAVNVLFVDALHSARSRHKTYTRRNPQTLDQLIIDGSVDTLYLPLHVNGNHWTLLLLDLVNRQYAYGDSLNHSATVSPNVLDILVWWLDVIQLDRSKSKFTLSPQSLPIPRQNDGFSCGIIVLSTIASELLGFSPWTQGDHACQRMEWFLRLSQNLQNRNVRLSSCFSNQPFNSYPQQPANQFGHDDSNNVTNTGSASSLPPGSGESSSINTTSDGNGILQLDCVDSMFVDTNPISPLAGSSTTSPPLLHGASMPGDIPASAPKVSKRRKKVLRNPSPSSSAESDSNEFRVQALRYRRLNHSGAKASSSWAYQKALNTEAQGSEFTPNDTRLSKFQAKIILDDPHAEFDLNDLRKVRCSHCATWITMRTLYEVRRWTEHRNSLKCQSRQQKGLVNKSIRNFFSSPAGASLSNIRKYPCPGLTREQNPRVSHYLKRSLAAGGGAPSRTNIAEVLFGVDAVYALLPDAQKKMVVRREELLFQWKNSRAVGAVFSSKCQKETPGRQDDNQLLPCAECRDLLKLHTFQVALNRPIPDDANMKFTPISHRDLDVGDIYFKVKGIRDLVETVCPIFSTQINTRFTISCFRMMATHHGSNLREVLLMAFMQNKMFCWEWWRLW